MVKVGMSTLLPFGKTKVEEFQPHSKDTLQFQKEFFVKVTKQIRKEGDIFKKSIELNSKLDDKCKQELNSKADNLSIGYADSDEIKDLLLKNDIS